MPLLSCTDLYGLTKSVERTEKKKNKKKKQSSEMFPHGAPKGTAFSGSEEERMNMRAPNAHPDHYQNSQQYRRGKLIVNQPHLPPQTATCKASPSRLLTDGQQKKKNINTFRSYIAQHNVFCALLPFAWDLDPSGKYSIRNIYRHLSNPTNRMYIFIRLAMYFFLSFFFSSNKTHFEGESRAGQGFDADRFSRFTSFRPRV